MARGRVWQALLDWWKPAGSAAAPADESVAGDAVDWRGAEPAVDASEGWERRKLFSQDVAGSAAEDEVSDQELLDFLAAAVYLAHCRLLRGTDVIGDSHIENG